MPIINFHTTPDLNLLPNAFFTWKVRWLPQYVRTLVSCLLASLFALSSLSYSRACSQKYTFFLKAFQRLSSINMHETKKVFSKRPSLKNIFQHLQKNFLRLSGLTIQKLEVQTKQLIINGFIDLEKNSQLFEIIMQLSIEGNLILHPSAKNKLLWQFKLTYLNEKFFTTHD